MGLLDVPAMSRGQADNRYIRSVIAAGPGIDPTGATDSTAALQAKIDAVSAGGRLFVPAGTYVISASLTTSGDATIEGEGCNEVFHTDFDTPGQAPYLRGTVFKQVTAATDGFRLTGVAQDTRLSGFGILFDSAITGNTGHGINAVPSDGTSSGQVGSRWSDIVVYGHDGYHYAFYRLNQMHCTDEMLRSYGGGGFFVECNSTAGNYGNLVSIHPYCVINQIGSAGGYVHKARTSAVSNTGMLGLMTYIRPQCNLEANGTGQLTWDDLQGSGVPANIVAINADLENGPSGNYGMRSGGGTEFIGGTQRNRGDQNNLSYGYGALSNPTGGNNAAFGINAAHANTTGNTNAAFGYNALASGASGASNTAVGGGALAAADNSYNTAVGAGALGPTTGWKNVAVGWNAGPTTAQRDGTTSLGAGAVADGSGAVAIGASASATAGGSVAIGFDSAGTPASATLQDSIALGTALSKLQLKNNTTGSGSAALGANCPATTATAPHTWIAMLAGDGSTVYVPAWK